jgi:serine/threonine protein kinase
MKFVGGGGDPKYCVFKSVSKESVRRHRDERHLRCEKEVLSALGDCSFCVKLFATFQDKTHLHFALEFAVGGELFHRLGRQRVFPPDTAKFYLCEVFVALEHLQALGFVYRDLKPENIMIDDQGHCKLVDFGFSVAVGSGGGGAASSMLHTLCGTPAYLAPEILDGKFTNGYTKIVDWWSFGILLFELLTGSTPFCRSNSDTHYEIFLRILKNKISFPMSFESKARDLVSQLTHPQIARRLGDPQTIKQHPYFHFTPQPQKGNELQISNSINWKLVEKRKLVPPFVPRIKEPGDSHYFNKYGGDDNSGLRMVDGGRNSMDFFDF